MILKHQTCPCGANPPVDPTCCRRAWEYGEFNKSGHQNLLKNEERHLFSHLRVLLFLTPTRWDATKIGCCFEGPALQNMFLSAYLDHKQMNWLPCILFFLKSTWTMDQYYSSLKERMKEEGNHHKRSCATSQKLLELFVESFS